jgi:hypothetical protein
MALRSRKRIGKEVEERIGEVYHSIEPICLDAKGSWKKQSSSELEGKGGRE